MTEARENLTTATGLMPEDRGEAAKLLAVLGNDALLSLELGDDARAMRLADQMLNIREAAGATTLSNEINLVRVRAALERRRGDRTREAAIFKTGVTLLEEQVPEDWMRRLDLVSDYVDASLGNAPQDSAIGYLSRLCEAAPEDMAWIGRFMLARLQIGAGKIDAAQDNLTRVIAAFVGGGSPAGEVEIIQELASLCEHSGNRAASVFLGKLTLKYLSEIAHAFEGSTQRRIVEAGGQIARQTAAHLRASGRFEEALALEALVERIQRHAYLLREKPMAASPPAPVPLDQAERRAEANWLNAREALGKMRNDGDREGAKQLAEGMVDDLVGFENTSGLNRQPVNAAHPSGRNLRLSLVPSGDTCVVHYRWSARSKTVKTDISAQDLFNLVADLRDAVADRSAWQHPAALLYRHLIAPIRDELSQIDCLEIDAVGILGRIPFGLLSEGGQCLVQQVPIKYVIDAAPPTTAPPPRLGLLHCAAFESGPLATAPDFITTAPPSLQPLAVLDAHAFTREGFLEGLRARPAYLSVATHLESEPTRPNHSALWLGSEAPLYLSDFGGEHFDLHGIRVALLATCSSGLDDATELRKTSLAALSLEKGVSSFVGTLWDISESAAARFVDEFWGAFNANSLQDPAILLAKLQSRYAKRAQTAEVSSTASGGIGERSHDIAPTDWAAFAVYGNSNAVQHAGDRGTGQFDRNKEHQQEAD
ncbi:CHAT domain-containing protein [Alisedimentitalea sp. MJ-SS2]|uniref:CHAT domain-containing protein n=1 Tax=Aliisedimentitalea sp. MJ-SS2 TaxID=3049795 RepID=UPI00290F0188|nr:CHAT domain-containing protein [Alisedimentitalea sp. MJ-SS2]MDU8929923.1 CHAT domain-containing protein [Alisedimentitalea sp. MJ-SS2]